MNVSPVPTTATVMPYAAILQVHLRAPVNSDTKGMALHALVSSYTLTRLCIENGRMTRGWGGSEIAGEGAG